jgi:hypothetical protein
MLQQTPMQGKKFFFKRKRKSIVNMEMLRKYCPARNQATLREVRDLGIYLTPAVPDELTLKILAPGAVKL